MKLSYQMLFNSFKILDRKNPKRTKKQYIKYIIKQYSPPPPIQLKINTEKG